MQRNYIRTITTFFIIALSLSLFSCKGAGGMERKLLFTLSLGRGEDQIDLIQMANVPFDKKTRIVMKDGLIYIGNGNSNKIMEFSSYGDILSLYYNSSENPAPAILSQVSGEGDISNRNAYAFDFRNTGEIAVTKGNDILVEDTVPENRIDYDETTDTILNRIVLRFNKDGDFIYFLGREGIGGTPFSYIERIYVNTKDEIIIVSRTLSAWIVYWFSENGTLKYTVNIPLNDLPVPPDGDYIPSLDTIVPDYNNYSLFLKIDYYNKDSRDLQYTASFLWKLDIGKKTYTGSVRIPDLESSDFDDIPGFLGINTSGYFFFLVHKSGNDFQLMVISEGGTVIARSDLVMEDDEISYRDLYLDPSGLLVALLGKYDRTEIVWWRSDLLRGVQNEDSKS